MGTAWPQKYHSSRGHASAILAQNKTSSHVALANASTTTKTLAEPAAPKVQQRRRRQRRPRQPSSNRLEPTTATPAATTTKSPHQQRQNGRPQPASFSGKSEGTSDAADVVHSVGPVGDRNSSVSLPLSTSTGTGVGKADDCSVLRPVAAQLSLYLWWLLFAKAIFSTRIDDPGRCWFRPLTEGWYHAIAGGQGSIKALPIRDYKRHSATTKSTTTTTTMNASNQITLNRFIRLTVTLLITRTLMLRRLLLTTTTAVVLMSDRNQTKKKQPNAAIVTSIVRSRLRPVKTMVKTTTPRWPQFYGYSNCCWPSSYRHPLPYSAASATTAVAIISHSVPRQHHGDDDNNNNNNSNSNNNDEVKRLIAIHAVVVVAVVVKAKKTQEMNDNDDDEDGSLDNRSQMVTRRSQPVVFRKWSNYSCQHCSLLTCSRFFTERRPLSLS